MKRGEMRLFWNTAALVERKRLIIEANQYLCRPDLSLGLVAYEAGLKWDKLLPSTQDRLIAKSEELNEPKYN
jgi:hypothetical protein